VELINLRKIIDERQQDINRLHEKWVEEIDKARVEVQFSMETEFQAREARGKHTLTIQRYSFSEVRSLARRSVQKTQGARGPE